MPSRRLLLLASIVLTACPASDDTADEVGDTPADDSGGTAADTSAGDDGSTTASTLPGESSGGDSSGGGVPGPPEIEMITWTQAEGCMMSTVSDVTVVVTVVDPDNATSELTFGGLAIGCTGEINMAESIIQCPQIATYNATVTVEDPDGGMDSLDIMIMPCMDGMAP